MPRRPASSSVFSQKISSFCDMRLACAMSSYDHENLRSYMLGFVTRRARPPQNAGKLDWKEIAVACDLNSERLRIAKRVAQPGFEAIIRWLEETEIAAANVCGRRPVPYNGGR
jgi:hypothetical protein